MCNVITYSKSKHHSGKVANPPRGQLKGKMNISLTPFAPEKCCSCETGSAASASSFSTLRLNMMLTQEILPDFRSGVHFLCRHTPSGRSRVFRITQLRTDGIHCRESAGTGPVVLKVVPVTGAAIL